jgi:hypothetical protein
LCRSGRQDRRLAAAAIRPQFEITDLSLPLPIAEQSGLTQGRGRQRARAGTFSFLKKTHNTVYFPEQKRFPIRNKSSRPGCKIVAKALKSRRFVGNLQPPFRPFLVRPAPALGYKFSNAMSVGHLGEAT